MENIPINNNVNAQKALDTAMSKTLREFKFNETDHQLVNPTATELIDKFLKVNSDALTSLLLDNFKASLHEEFYLDSCKQVAEHYGLKESMFDQK
ncbi:hypothetical protein C5L30_000270 [Companilactobacillus farciminis]|jgi:hypothetical protein|uniref:Uncharacterized protein n=1 Tax=Companilactobacillus farciminis TaxID=1612 RepID=A0A4R5NK08_9LACO|nr:hypothetical protein [Companilactobacillus farciminis]ATO46080.1 hypothetical protein LF20184_04625 [Companilactobacillus farciminis KCTC 3681 = DSM 20184]KRK62466.1 hypothetical protein FC68_GL001992 [Companilactobacillus farciminis KCTC 3681 = DSM 20184]TDG74554.1 hypothetical protein C5L30_000270 [Companilactobacillus farciminis]